MVKLVPKGNKLHIGLVALKACLLLVTGMYGEEYYTRNEYVKNLGKVPDCFTFGPGILGIKWISLLFEFIKTLSDC